MESLLSSPRFLRVYKAHQGSGSLGVSDAWIIPRCLPAGPAPRYFISMKRAIWKQFNSFGSQGPARVLQQQMDTGTLPVHGYKCRLSHHHPLPHLGEETPEMSCHHSWKDHLVASHPHETRGELHGQLQTTALLHTWGSALPQTFLENPSKPLHGSRALPHDSGSMRGHCGAGFLGMICSSAFPGTGS